MGFSQKRYPHAVCHSREGVELWRYPATSTRVEPKYERFSVADAVFETSEAGEFRSAHAPYGSGEMCHGTCPLYSEGSLYANITTELLALHALGEFTSQFDIAAHPDLSGSKCLKRRDFATCHRGPDRRIGDDLEVWIVRRSFRN